MNNMQLKFYKITRETWFPETGKLSVYLKVDDWNDYSYQTLYEILLFDENGTKHDLGNIKIAYFGQTTEKRTELPIKFTQLDEQYFSLGQNVDYYIKVQTLTPKLKEQLLVGLHDIVYNEALQKQALKEDVTTTSLFVEATNELAKLNNSFTLYPLKKRLRKKHLQKEFLKLKNLHLNSWESALYPALSESDLL